MAVKVNVTGYESRKVVVAGKGTEEFVSMIIEPEITGAAKLGYDEVNHPDAERVADQEAILEKLRALIQRLKPLDQDVFLLYLEGLDARVIAEIVGISPGNVAQKIHRAKKYLQQHFPTGDSHDES